MKFPIPQQMNSKERELRKWSNMYSSTNQLRILLCFTYLTPLMFFKMLGEHIRLACWVPLSCVTAHRKQLIQVILFFFHKSADKPSIRIACPSRLCQSHCYLILNEVCLINSFHAMTLVKVRWGSSYKKTRRQQKALFFLDRLRKQWCAWR